MVANSVEQLYERLARTGIKAVEWGERNHIAFKNSNDEMITFTRRWKPGLMWRLAQAKITVRSHTLGFHINVIWSLRVYLDSGLRLWVHHNL